MTSNKSFDGKFCIEDYSEISQGALGANMALNSKRANMKINFLNDIIKDESGATAIEYGLIAAVMAVIIIAAFGSVENLITGLFDRVETAVDTAGEGTT